MAEKIMLLDGHSLINRAFYGLPDLTNAKGQHTNAVLGFLNIMLKYVEEEKPTHLLVAFDRKEPTFRHIQYKEYKGNRKSMPEELREQVPLVKSILKSMEIPVVTQAGIEADDILGTIAYDAQKNGMEAVVVSGDRDLLQLATDRIKIKLPRTKGGKTVTEDYYESDFIESYGVTPKEFIDMKGLMGDTSDNIPGVPGIGEKTAAKIIKEYHTIENAYDHIDEVKPTKAKNNLKEYYDQAIMSKELAAIKTDCELDYQFTEAVIGKIFTKDAYQLLKSLELKSLLKYFDEDEKTDESVKVEIISDLCEAESFFSRMIKASKAFGLGVIGDVKMCKGISVTDQEKTALLLCQGMISQEYLMDRLCDVLKEGNTLWCLDYKALLHMDERFSKWEESVEDAGLMAYLINPLQSSYDYDDLARDYLGMTLPARKEVCKKQTVGEAFEESIPETVQLAAYLSMVPYKVREILSEKLGDLQLMNLYCEIEKPTVYPLYLMEKYGISVQKEALWQYGEQLNDRINELENLIYQQAGKEFNINSPKQLGVILFEDLKMPFAKKTKTGYSTNAEILDKLAPDYPIVKDILEYRQLTKLKSTYAVGLSAFIEEDGKIRSIFHQKVTATGRLSSSDPNLQNIPIRMPLGRAIRKVFTPEPGYLFISADYSQIELRVLAHMADDQNLIDAYRHDADIHTATAAQVFGVPIEEVTPLLRRNAKAVNFGIVYGISAFGLSQDLNITRKEANDYIDRYFKTYPGIKEYLDQNVEYAKEHGFVKTLYGRIRPIPELFSSNFMQRSFGERAAMNSSIQGTAADIIKIAMIRVTKRMKEENLASRLILQIHDELLIETKEEEAEIVEQILREEMMGAASLKVPLIVDVSKGKNWYEAK